MRRLISSEFLRARSRRVVPMMVVGALAGVLIGVTIGTIVAEGKDSTAVRRGQRMYELGVRRCLDGNYGPVPDAYASLEEFCTEAVRPESFGPDSLDFFDLDALLEGTASLVIMLGAFLGATLGGADWSAGTMGTLLTWEPRRLRILAARAVVVSIVVFAIAVGAQIWLSAVFAGGVAVKGSFVGTPDGFMGDVAISIVRVASASALFSLIGLAFATIGRSTVSGISAFLGYLIIVELFIANLVFVTARFTFGRAAVAMTSGEALLLVNPRPPRVDPAPDQLEFLLQPGRAWLTVIGWVVVMLLVASASFRGRDVT
ncbi:MAG: hypothetical protein WD096_09205 [Actinomycetota bacterium]